MKRAWLYLLVSSYTKLREIKKNSKKVKQKDQRNEV
jgi:hypothetical protein